MLRKFIFIATLIMSIPLYAIWGPESSPLTYGNQTIPTRTPTPAITEPGDPGGGGGGEDPPTATIQPISSETATSTLIPITPAATPEGGFLPTAVVCSNNPTVFSNQGTTNVRSGPGTDYEAVGQLVFLEVRPILGKAEHAPWWFIQMDDGENGWVANIAISVSGNTAVVPIVVPPLVNGVSPTSGPQFLPTANPVCPTLTPTPETISEPTAAASATPEPPTATATDTIVPSETPFQPTPTPVPLGTSPAMNFVATAVDSAAPLPNEATEDGNGLGIYVLATAIFIIISGGIFLRRRRS